MRKIPASEEKNIKEYVRKHRSLTAVYKVLAKKYGCSWETIRRICDKQYRKNVYQAQQKAAIRRRFMENQHLFSLKDCDIFLTKINNNITYEEIGRKYGITRQRVEQIINKILKRLHYKSWLRDERGGK